MPRYPATDAVPTIRPRPSASMVGTTASRACTVPIRFVCSWSANASLSQCSGRNRDQVPALSTATSSPPRAARTVSPAATVASRSVTSTGTTSIRSAATSRSFPRLRALIATEAPRSASSRASAAPMPLEAPVTQTRAPEISTSGLPEGMPGQPELAHPEVTDSEPGLAVGEVELPHPPEGVVERARQLLPVAQELFPPQRQRAGVVRAEVAPLDDGQAGVRGQVVRDRPERRDDPTGEHVLVDPGVAAAGGHHPVVGDGDGLEPDPAARGQQAVQLREVGRPVR